MVNFTTTFQETNESFNTGFAESDKSFDSEFSTITIVKEYDGSLYKIGHGLKLDGATNTLSVDTADSVERDNTLPITSAAVHTTVGNIEILLGTI